jgi:hypothetical protein
MIGLADRLRIVGDKTKTVRFVLRRTAAPTSGR